MYYTYKAVYPNCYALLRPDGSECAFLQGDDARDFERQVNRIKGIARFPHGCIRSLEYGISITVDAYDYDKWKDAEIIAQGNFESANNIF